MKKILLLLIITTSVLFGQVINPYRTLQVDTLSITTMNGNLSLPNTTNSNQFGLRFGGNRFLHNFNYGNNGTVTTDGFNTFLGANAGNFTMGSTATSASHSSYNTGIGGSTLSSLTTGNLNSGLGVNALYSLTTGNSNSGMGTNALYSLTTGSSNSGMGINALSSLTTGTFNSGVGTNVLSSLTTGSYNSGIGTYALYSLTTGSYNSGLGVNAGRFGSDSTTANDSTNNSVYIGAHTRSGAINTSTNTNETVIGYNAVGNGSNTVTLGNSSVTSTFLRGYIYLVGNSTTDGSWRMSATLSGNCIIEYRSGGTWSAKQTLTP